MLLYEDLSNKIIKAYYHVLDTLGTGLLEKVYENAMCIELEEMGLPFEQQKAMNVIYKGHLVGNYIADIIVDNKIILELKAADELVSENRMQLFNYMRLTKITYGMLINFSKDHGVRFERYFLDTATNNCSIF